MYLWEDYIADVYSLLESVHKKSNPEYVFGIPRAGAIIATIVSHALNIPLVDQYIVNAITGAHKSDRTLLVVDDFCDTGSSLLPYQSCLTAVLHLCKREGRLYTPDIYLREVPESLVYPYEGEVYEKTPQVAAVPDYRVREADHGYRGVIRAIRTEAGEP